MLFNLLVQIRGQDKVKVRPVTWLDLMIGSCVMYAYRGSWTPEFVSVMHLRHRRFTFTAVGTRSSELPDLPSAGSHRPPPPPGRVMKNALPGGGLTDS